MGVEKASYPAWEAHQQAKQEISETSPFRIAKEAFFAQAKEDIVTEFIAAQEDNNADIVAFSFDVLQEALEAQGYFDDDEQLLLSEDQIIGLLRSYVPKVQQLHNEQISLDFSSKKIEKQEQRYRLVQEALEQNHEIRNGGTVRSKKMTAKEVQGMIALSVDWTKRAHVYKNKERVMKSRKVDQLKFIDQVREEVFNRYFSADELQKEREKLVHAWSKLKSQLIEQRYFDHEENPLLTEELLYERLCLLIGRMSPQEESEIKLAREYRIRDRKAKLFRAYQMTEESLIHRGKNDWVEDFRRAYHEIESNLEREGYFFDLDATIIDQKGLYERMIRFLQQEKSQMRKNTQQHVGEAAAA